VNARASWAVRGRRQECQRLGAHASRREDNARHGGIIKKSCDPPKRVGLPWSSRSLRSRKARKRSDATENDEAWVLVRGSELAETGSTHRASRRRARRKAGPERDAGPGALRMTC